MGSEKGSAEHWRTARHKVRISNLSELAKAILYSLIDAHIEGDQRRIQTLSELWDFFGFGKKSS
jgi:hypothetical protein